MASAAAFAATPRAAVGQVTTLDATFDASTAGVTVFTAGSSGSHIDHIKVSPITTTAETFRIFLNNGTSTRYLDQVTTPGGTPIVAPVLPGGFDIPNGWSVVATTVGGQSANVFVFGGDY